VKLDSFGSGDPDLGRLNIPQKKKISYLEELLLCFLWRAEASSVPPSYMVKIEIYRVFMIYKRIFFLQYVFFILFLEKTSF
jgi:hypothetical protein